MSAASVRLVPAAAGGRPPHRLHQVQEAGHRAPGLQRGAGEGPQVSTIPYHTLPYHTLPYHTLVPYCANWVAQPSCCKNWGQRMLEKVNNNFNFGTCVSDNQEKAEV